MNLIDFKALVSDVVGTLIDVETGPLAPARKAAVRQPNI
jgi:hypothetical protein